MQATSKIPSSHPIWSWVAHWRQIAPVLYITTLGLHLLGFPAKLQIIRENKSKEATMKTFFRCFAIYLCLCFHVCMPSGASSLKVLPAASWLYSQCVFHVADAHSEELDSGSSASCLLAQRHLSSSLQRVAWKPQVLIKTPCICTCVSSA